jgi:hypothetical protein
MRIDWRRGSPQGGAKALILPLCRGQVTCACVLVTLCGLASSGCGSGAPHAESSLTEATVAGRVVTSGKPITKGQVIFDPANVNRPREAARTADIAPDGSYKVTTLIGENRVTVAIPGRARKAGSPYVQEICKVSPGENTFDIRLP